MVLGRAPQQKPRKAKSGKFNFLGVFQKKSAEMDEKVGSGVGADFEVREILPLGRLFKINYFVRNR